MDKAEFIRLAPLYYALAIVLKFARSGGPFTQQSIADDYTIEIEGGSPEDAACLVENSNIWDRAIKWLVERDVLVAFTDPFGPPVYKKGDTFDSQINDLFASTAPFETARASGDPSRWTFQALRRVYEEEIRLGVRPSDFEEPDREWAPLPLDRDQPALQTAIACLDQTITEVEQSNGYASEYPEERNFVLVS